ncbi:MULTISPECIES: Com family DNA-binding transcriptional regulator [Delftia]|uniref:Com family DNA-binding transcriptional regulator n=1 Tax=Delftia TaxID=80865 RepID=UPI00298F14DE|nr:Com family DNA-binding transcriptional regulator [Delftia acidovorans]
MPAGCANASAASSFWPRSRARRPCAFAVRPCRHDWHCMHPRAATAGCASSPHVRQSGVPPHNTLWPQHNEIALERVAEPWRPDPRCSPSSPEGRAMQEVRCASCNRKLAMGVFQQLSIKCPRCGTLNSLRAHMSPEPECLRAPLKKGSHHGSSN